MHELIVEGEAAASARGRVQQSTRAQRLRTRSLWAAGAALVVLAFVYV